MFMNELKAAADQIQATLDTAMGPLGQTPVEQGMRYACTGGKRLRGFLVLETARLHGLDIKTALHPAAAIEALHAYSLVHDDLPCMDDDDLRRGQPTVHVKWDDATAVLVGDALQTLAFELLCHSDNGNADVRMKLVSTLAKASGAQGMVLGQAQDIAAETATDPLGLDEITQLQANKTGALISWSAQAGAILAQADPEPLRQYAQAVGLAFQIADDILDVEGDATKAGKKLQKDADAGKATFVSLMGLDAARTKAAELVDQAVDAVSVYGERAQGLRQIAAFVIERDT
ncbi:polyprenyl synthetase family protein [Algirhabdus cladophorae]|uniref:polyprenyl synthetase family protein n=1 Tax=Algirhabdus cladophorae TaxID=3377108 RepID=UPI003B8461CD